MILIVKYLLRTAFRPSFVTTRKLGIASVAAMQSPLRPPQIKDGSSALHALITMRAEVATLSACALLLLARFLCSAAQPPLWTGMHADACRSNRGRVSGPLAASPVLLRNVSFPDYGKTHGTPAIDSQGRVFAVFWLQGAGKVLLRRWDVDGTVFDVMLPTFGSDIIEDSNDALLLSDAGVAYVTFSYYSPATCLNCTSLFAVRCDDGATLWSVNYHPFIDSMAMHTPPSSSTPVLLVLSSQSRQLLMYATGTSHCFVR